MTKIEHLLLSQGLYYLITGVWPLVHRRSFLKVTGPKTDLWLVNTAGVLIGVIGGVLTKGGFRPKESTEAPLLSMAAAAGLAGIDVVYWAKRQIGRVYLLDALMEMGFLASWLLKRGRR